MAESLSIWGFEVAIARDGNSPLEIARSFEPDAIRLDICRAGIDGYEVTRGACWAYSASGNHSATRGYGQERDCEPSCLAGFDYHLVKTRQPRRTTGYTIRELGLFLRRLLSTRFGLPGGNGAIRL
jgi:CheY-like chemotaxis protein